MSRGFSPSIVPLAYPIPIPSKLKGLAYNFEKQVKRLVRQVLPGFWSEELVDKVYAYGLELDEDSGTVKHRLPAYKFFEQELKVNNPWHIGLP